MKVPRARKNTNAGTDIQNTNADASSPCRARRNATAQAHTTRTKSGGVISIWPATKRPSVMAGRHAAGWRSTRWNWIDAHACCWFQSRIGTSPSAMIAAAT